MTFEKWLQENRSYKVKVAKPNPSYADELRNELDRHLYTIEKWIDGSVDRRAMADAMHFFGTRYPAKGAIYRGTENLVFDGKPASYTKSKELAEGFAIAAAQNHWFFKGNMVYVIERRAPSNSLDFKKLLKSYATGEHYRSEESEVIIYNTPVADRNITEINITD